MSDHESQRLEQLGAEARYHRQRLDLYRARLYGGRAQPGEGRRVRARLRRRCRPSPPGQRSGLACPPPKLSATRRPATGSPAQTRSPSTQEHRVARPSPLLRGPLREQTGPAVGPVSLNSALPRRAGRASAYYRFFGRDAWPQGQLEGWYSARRLSDVPLLVRDESLRGAGGRPHASTSGSVVALGIRLDDGHRGLGQTLG